MAEKQTEKKSRDEDAAAEPASAKAGKRRPGKPGEEVGGPKGPDPTRFGDWERNGRCIDF